MRKNPFQAADNFFVIHPRSSVFIGG